MKKILGLDLGVASIGWALISEDDERKPIDILGMGCRIIPYSGTEDDDFSKGSGESKCSQRTQKRTMRKGYDRYQLRKAYLKDKLTRLNMMPGRDLFKLDAISLYQLREKALNERIELTELGRIFFHLNQKRGYRHSRQDNSSDPGQKEYVAQVNSRFDAIKKEGLTVGQYFLKGLRESSAYRIKEQVFPRQAYMEEFDLIWKKQMEYYPDVLEPGNYEMIRNEIIYYQRPLKSCKHLISVCEFEGKNYEHDGKIVFAGPKVAPRSSPLFQVCKIWETINNISLTNRKGDKLELTLDQKRQLFNYLDNNEKLTLTELIKILGLNEEEGYYGGELISKGLPGNTTKVTLRKILSGLPDCEKYMQFEFRQSLDIDTGEWNKTLSDDFEKQPLYRLWHSVYSQKGKSELGSALQNKFGITSEEIVKSISKIDFVKLGYGNKSARAIRKLLPFLEQGYIYSEACQLAGFDHTAKSSVVQKLQPKLELLRKSSLRQPIVEKILNQMVHVVNAIIDEWGKPDEIRVELARELKQSKKERIKASRAQGERERLNMAISRQIIEEYNLVATRKRIEKWKLFKEINGNDSKIHATCLYCGRLFGLKEALTGEDVEVEHIIPRSVFFDDSLSNKTLTHRHCNADKKTMTALDFIKTTKTQEEFEDYLQRVEDLFKRKVISKTKRDRLLTAGDKIPEDFLNRQLRETQYIAKKSIEILKQVCPQVTSTTGSVTERVRRLWGWGDILEKIQLKRYREYAQTEWIEVERNGQIHREERIVNWTKRDDHRHHAIDALAVACTHQAIIQRLNTLSSHMSSEVLYMKSKERNIEMDGRLTKFENWLVQQPHFPCARVTEAVEGILISFKAGKKVATPGKRYQFKNGKRVVVQDNILVPRGALSEESVYGKIRTLQRNVPLKKLLENPQIIVKPAIRKHVEDRLAACEGDVSKTMKSIKADPVYLDVEKRVPLEWASVFKEELVIKYPITTLKEKDLPYIVDDGVRKVIRERMSRLGEKNAFKDIENDPVYLTPESKIPIRTVRLFARLDPGKVAPVKFNEAKEPIGYVKPGNNHHVAIYTDSQGNKQEHVVTFWHAVERKKYGLPVIISDTDALWDSLLNTQLPDSFLQLLPSPGLNLLISMQQNELFVLDLLEEKERVLSMKYSELSKCLYRVGYISKSDYTLFSHLETKERKEATDRESKRYYRIKSVSRLLELNPVKVPLNVLGKISF